MQTAKSFIFTILFFPLFIIALIIMGISKHINEKIFISIHKLFCKTFKAMMRNILGLSYTLKNLEKIPKGPILIVSNHQSAWDTIIFGVLFNDVAYIYKKQLDNVPLFGWFLRTFNMISIDRSKGAKALRDMLERAKEVVANQRPIVIFPEGTRVAPGKSVKFQRGVALMYEHLGIPVVPVALNSGMYWGKRSFIKKPGTIQVEFLPKIDPGLPNDIFMKVLTNRIKTASNRLMKDAQKELKLNVAKSS